MPRKNHSPRVRRIQTAKPSRFDVLIGKALASLPGAIVADASATRFIHTKGE